MNVKRELTNLVRQPSTDEGDFIDFWSSLYDDPRADLYSENIGLPLTKERLMRLFEWKNGGKIAKKKRKSIVDNYIKNKPRAPKYGNKSAEHAFITKPGGAIWRIFWLHCKSPQQYPIFDQHVYRAMLHIRGSQITKLPVSAKAVATIYLDEYKQFNSTFGSRNLKKIDEALWAYGKFLSRYPRNP